MFTSVYIRQKRTSNMEKRKAAEAAQTNKDDEEIQLKEDWTKLKELWLNYVLRLYIFSYWTKNNDLACFDIYLFDNTHYQCKRYKCALDF